MAGLTLVIGDKNLSTWSMRPWLVAKASGLPFKEVKILLDRPSTRGLIRKYSPSGRVPVLIHGKTRIWDSLAICEYLAELAPEKNLWPRDPHARAVARSLAAEMHSGFASMRGQLSMDLSLRIQVKHLTEGTIADIRRVLHIWSASLKTNGGPFLAGEFGIVDAFYAPVVMRFVSYGIEVKDPRCRRYMANIQSHPAVRDWLAGAKKEKPVRYRL